MFTWYNEASFSVPPKRREKNCHFPYNDCVAVIIPCIYQIINPFFRGSQVAYLRRVTQTPVRKTFITSFERKGSVLRRYLDNLDSSARGIISRVHSSADFSVENGDQNR